MASKLPSMKKSVSSIKLGSKKISFRPFSGEEEKTILTAKMNDKDKAALTQAFIDVTSACTSMDTGVLTVGEFEQLALEIRRISVGEILDVSVPCKCGKIHPMKIPVDQLVIPDASPKDLDLDVGKDEEGNDVKLVIKSPSIQAFADNQNLEDAELRIIHASLVGAFWADESVTEIEYEEFHDWFMSLSGAYARAVLFVSEVPKVTYEKTFKCLECKEDVNVKLRGIRDFFSR